MSPSNETTDLREVSDAALVIAIGRSRHDALAEAYRRHAPFVYAAANGDTESVETTFLELWSDPERFDPEQESLRSFLVESARSGETAAESESREVPAEVWERVSKGAMTTKPESSSNRWVLVLAALTAIAAAIAAIAGVAVIKQNSRLEKIETRMASGSVEQSALVANADPTNRHVTLISDDHKYRVDAVVTDEGGGFIIDGNLPRLEDSKTYQLWAVSGSEKVSIALIGQEAEPAAFQVPDTASTLFITEEVETGVVVSKQPALVSGALTK